MKENTVKTYAAGMAREDYLARVAPWEVRHGKGIEQFTDFLKIVLPVSVTFGYILITMKNSIRNSIIYKIT